MGNSSSSQHSPTTNANKSELIQAQQTLQSAPINIVTQLQQVSRKKSEEEKILQLNQIPNYIENLDGNQLITEIDIKLCIELKKLIGVCKTSFQQEILNIILIIAEKGSEMVERFEKNKFYQIFEESGLMKRINEIFLLQIKIQQIKNKIYQYIDLFSKIVFIISFINKYSDIDQNILEKCGKYFKFQINEQIQILRNFKNKNQQGKQQKQQIKQQIESEIRRISKMIIAISGVVECWENNMFLIVQLKIHEDIAPLIHLRCPQQLNCPQSLNLPESESSNQLLSSVFHCLVELSWALNDVNSFHTLSSSSVITESLNFALPLLNQNVSFCKIAYKTPELIKTLIQLTGFERKQHQSNKIDKSNAQIRIWSNNFLDRINCNGDKYMKQGILNEFNFIKKQTEFICLGGGSEEQTDEEIQSGLSNLYNINYISQMKNNKQNHRQTILLKTINEDLEFEGGLEEIEANQFHNKQLKNDYVKFNAYRTKNIITNFQKDDSNN